MEDRRAQEEILDRIAEFNAKPMHLPVAITGRTIRQSLKNRVVNEAKRIDGALIQNPRLGEMLREQLPDLVYR